MTCVLYFADTRFPLERANGIQTFETCHALARRGHEVRLVVRQDTQEPPRDPVAFYGADPLDRLSIQRLRLPGPPAVRRAAFLGTAMELASRRDADLVFTRDLGVATALLRLPRSLRPPVVFESHGIAAVVSASLGHLLSTGTNATPRKARRLLARERRVWRRAEGYVTLTRSLEDALTGEFGPRGAVHVVPDGTRLSPTRTFTPPQPTAAPLLAYAGHLYPWKGVDTLVRALALLPGVRGLIVGGHPQEPDIDRVRALADSLGVAARITFTGLVAPERVAGLLAPADVLVLPNGASRVSASFTSPLKLFEYLAAGKPIVASDLPAFREVLEPEVHALLVTPDSPEAIAAAVQRLVRDRSLAGRLARAAFDLAAEYSWDARAKRLERVFDQATAKGD
jgi:glycosyltransferase involved in cell wall biosynthesis